MLFQNKEDIRSNTIPNHQPENNDNNTTNDNNDNT